jgi:hypothetical protein
MATYIASRGRQPNIFFQCQHWIFLSRFDKGGVKKHEVIFFWFRGSYQEDLMDLCGCWRESQLNKSGNEAISSNARRKKFLR